MIDLNNQMLLYFLATIGKGMSKPGSFGASAGGAAEQMIQSKAYIDFLRGALSQGGKMTVDKDLVNIKAPTTLFGGELKGLETNPELMDYGKQISASRAKEQGGSAFSNPFGGSQSGFDYSSLAGLTPEHISSALSFAMKQEEMASESAYKAGLLDYYQRQTDIAAATETRKLAESLRSAPFQFPGMEMSFDVWKNLDAKTKAYTAYAFDADRRGNKVMDYNTWAEQVTPTDMERYWRLSMEHPEFFKFSEKWNKSKAMSVKVSLGEKLKEKEAMAELQGKLYFKDPKWMAEVNKYLSSKEVQSKLIEYPMTDLPKQKASVAIDYIESRIVGGTNGGTITDRSVDVANGIISWTVRWKDGETEVLRYAIER